MKLNFYSLKYNNSLTKFEDTNLIPSWLWSYGSWIYNYPCNQCLSALTLWVRISLMTKCTRYDSRWLSLSQWLVAGRWYSLGIPVSSTNKTDCHDITEILLKVTQNTKTLTLSIVRCILTYGQRKFLRMEMCNMMSLTVNWPLLLLALELL